MRKELLLVSFALLVLATHASAQVVVDKFSVQVSDVALVAKIHPFPTEPTEPTIVSPPVVVPHESGHSSSLSLHELQKSLYCTRTFDFKTRKWKICTITDDMRKNMVASWVKNRKKVGGNIPTWMN